MVKMLVAKRLVGKTLKAKILELHSDILLCSTNLYLKLNLQPACSVPSDTAYMKNTLPKSGLQVNSGYPPWLAGRVTAAACTEPQASLESSSVASADLSRGPPAFLIMFSVGVHLIRH